MNNTHRFVEGITSTSTAVDAATATQMRETLIEFIINTGDHRYDVAAVREASTQSHFCLMAPAFVSKKSPGIDLVVWRRYITCDPKKIEFTCTFGVHGRFLGPYTATCEHDPDIAVMIDVMKAGLAKLTRTLLNTSLTVNMSLAEYAAEYAMFTAAHKKEEGAGAQ